MRYALAILAVFATAGPALAQEARVRSGEHDTFSRLVVYLPQAAEYEVETGDGTFALEFGADFDFDTSEVFYYIPRTRIADLAAGDGRLALDLTCDCAVTVERLSPTAVFLDVNDPAMVDPTAATALPAPVGEAADGPQAAQAADAAPTAPVIRLPEIAPEAVATLLPMGLSVAEAPAAREAGAERPKRTSDTTRAVAQQIARAAAQGLVDVNAEAIPALDREQSPAGPQTTVQQPKFSDDVEASPTRHVSIRSSVDEALGREVADALSNAGMTGPCVADTAFDVAAWAPDGVETLPRLRSKVMDDVDRADADGVAALARAYVALSFGAEARAVLETFDVDVSDRDILLAMSRIVDGEPAGAPGRLAEQYDCSGPGALWAVLSRPDIPDAAELDSAAISLSFSALPPHLRKLLGPPLAERLLQHGARDLAGVIRTAILRAPGDPTAEVQLLEAALALDAGRGEEADETLAAVVDETSGRNAEAVERLLERHLEERRPVGDDVLAAADALIYEHRGTPLAHRLEELRLEALAISGQPDRAIAQLAERGRDLPRDSVERLRGVSYVQAARELDDAAFLLVAVKAADELGRSPEEMAARRAVAARLGEMELFALAATLGVEEGGAPPGERAPRSPSPAPLAAPTLRQALPEAEATLERTAALLEHSAALRKRLAETLGPTPETR